MATNSPKKQDTSKPDDIKTGDPLFNLHHAEAEAALAAKKEGDGTSPNDYMSAEEEENVDQAMMPRDSQGFVRGVPEPGVIRSNPGDLK